MSIVNVHILFDRSNFIWYDNYGDWRPHHYIVIKCLSSNYFFQLWFSMWYFTFFSHIFDKILCSLTSLITAVLQLNFLQAVSRFQINKISLEQFPIIIMRLVFTTTIIVHKVFSEKIMLILRTGTASKMFTRNFQHTTWTSGPPRTRIAFPEKCVHGIFICVGVLAGPMYILTQIESYKKRE